MLYIRVNKAEHTRIDILCNKSYAYCQLFPGRRKSIFLYMNYTNARLAYLNDGFNLFPTPHKNTDSIYQQENSHMHLTAWWNADKKLIKAHGHCKLHNWKPVLIITLKLQRFTVGA